MGTEAWVLPELWVEAEASIQALAPPLHPSREGPN